MAYNVSRGKMVKFERSRYRLGKRRQFSFDPMSSSQNKTMNDKPELRSKNSSSQIRMKKFDFKDDINSSDRRAFGRRYRYSQGLGAIFDDTSSISYIRDKRVYNRHIPIQHKSQSKRRRAKMMTMIYFCDSLKGQNTSFTKISSASIVKEYVENFKKMGAQIICEVTIPGVDEYKIIKRTNIPEYQDNESSNIGLGMFLTSLDNIVWYLDLAMSYQFIIEHFITTFNFRPHKKNATFDVCTTFSAASTVTLYVR